jgi:hypothetical protein
MIHVLGRSSPAREHPLSGLSFTVLEFEIMNHYKSQAAVYLLLLNIVLDTLKVAKKTLSYSEVGNLIGLQARSGTFHELLGQTMADDYAQSELPRCGLVVGKKDGRPGAAFYEVAANLGYPVQQGNEVAFHDAVLKQFGV